MGWIDWSIVLVILLLIPEKTRVWILGRTESVGSFLGKLAQFTAFTMLVIAVILIFFKGS